MRLDTSDEIRLVEALVARLENYRCNAQLARDLDLGKGVRVKMLLDFGHLKSLVAESEREAGRLGRMFSG